MLNWTRAKRGESFARQVEDAVREQYARSKHMDISSEDDKLECLARHICRLPTRQARREFLEGFERARAGRKALAEDLRARVERMFRERRERFQMTGRGE
jgi:hypothetical protein